MKQIKRILENQNEVQYLAYFLTQDERTGLISMELGTCGISKKFKFRDESACLTKLVDILFELRKLEKWAIAREGKKK